MSVCGSVNESDAADIEMVLAGQPHLLSCAELLALPGLCHDVGPMW